MDAYVLNTCFAAHGEQNHSQQSGIHEKTRVKKQTFIKRLKCQLQTSRGQFIITEANESLNKIFIKPQKNRPQFYVYSSLLTVRNLTSVLFSVLSILSTSNNGSSKDFFGKLNSQSLFLLISSFSFLFNFFPLFTELRISHRFSLFTVSIL